MKFDCPESGAELEDPFSQAWSPLEATFVDDFFFETALIRKTVN